jgi:hypothetical protein
MVQCYESGFAQIRIDLPYVADSVADPDPGSGIGAFLTLDPGSGIGLFRISDPKLIFLRA